MINTCAASVNYRNLVRNTCKDYAKVLGYHCMFLRLLYHFRATKTHHLGIIDF